MRRVIEETSVPSKSKTIVSSIVGGSAANAASSPHTPHRKAGLRPLTALRVFIIDASHVTYIDYKKNKNSAPRTRAAI